LISCSRHDITTIAVSSSTREAQYMSIFIFPIKGNSISYPSSS
jgi:hypothetical protein